MSIRSRFNNAQTLAGLGVFILMSLVAPLAAHASDPAYVEQLIQRVDHDKLYEDHAWQKILFMRERRFRKPQVMFDDPLFMLSGPGHRTDPRAEMIADIRRFAAPETMKIDKVRHPQCFFPARFEYLKEHLQIDPKRFTIQSCPDLEKFERFTNYTGVSLVFSNYFADNPASMFGHTLLRLHHSTEVGEPGLLDDAANFAAQVPYINPLTYPFQGLFGFFKGRFALLPYSEKIQEYNNYESRDLWEYDLNFSPVEVHRLALELWEVGSFYISYYYLDENCSYILLALLEAAKPELDLTSTFHLYAIPSDTVKAITRYPNMIRDIQFKPSARTRYLERARDLQAGERDLFLKILDRFEHSFNKAEFEGMLGGCDEACQVRLFDALIEFIDYKEKKISTKKIESYGDLRRGLLLARSHIHITSKPFTYRPEKARPDLGPRSSMVELNSGFTQKGFNISEFRWRPAHHDLASSPVGYSDQLSIQVMDTVIAHTADLNRTYLKRFSLLELTSLGEHELALSPKSWRLDLSYNSDRDLSDPSRFYQRTGLEFGAGGARFYGPFGAFVLVNFAGGYSTDPRLFWHVGVGPRAGAYYEFSDQLKWTTYFNWIHNYGRHHATERREMVSRFAFTWHKENEAGLEFRDQDGFYYWGAGYRFYY